MGIFRIGYVKMSFASSGGETEMVERCMSLIPPDGRVVPIPEEPIDIMETAAEAGDQAAIGSIVRADIIGDQLRYEDFLEKVTCFKCRLCKHLSESRTELIQHLKSKHEEDINCLEDMKNEDLPPESDITGLSFVLTDQKSVAGSCLDINESIVVRPEQAGSKEEDDETFMEYDITANHHDTSPPPRQSTPAHDMDSSPVAIHDDETISIEGSPHDDTISCEDGESSVPRAGMLTDENFNPMVRQLQDMGFEKTQAEASLALNSCLETAIQHLIVANQDKPSPPLEEDLLRANISSLNLVESRRTVTNGDCWYHFNIC